MQQQQQQLPRHERLRLELYEAVFRIKVRKQAKIRSRYNREPHTTQDTIWEFCKTHEKTAHTREPSTLSFPSRWTQGCREQTRQYDKDKHKTQITKRIHKRNTVLEGPVRNLLEGLNIFHGTNFTLNSGVDQCT